MPEFKLPDVGEGLTEAEIVEWKVAVGDVVAVNDVLVDIETAKSIVELPSPFAGEVTALLVEAGETVEVGTPIIAIGDSAPAPEPELDLSNPAASGGGEGESLVGRNKADRGPRRRPRKGSVTKADSGAAATGMQVQGAFSPGGAQSDDVVEGDEPAVPARDQRPAPVDPQPVHALVPERATSAVDLRVLAKPPVRKLAKDLGVDLSTLDPTGPNGTVSRADVERAASSAPEVGPSRGAGAPTSGTGVARSGTDRETREPIKGVRKMMAGAMVDSAFTAPHVTEWVTVDCTATMELVDRVAASREFRELKVSPLLFVAKAALLAMGRTPIINSTWDDAAGEVVVKHYVNLGIAAATPRGLVVPNIPGAESMSLVELATALGDLTATARSGKTPPEAMTGGSFTITNIGTFGIDAGTPIINPGESAILCMGAIERRPWVVGSGAEERIEPRWVTTLAISFDHRHIDGAAGSQFLADVAGILRDPGTALLF